MSEEVPEVRLSPDHRDVAIKGCENEWRVSNGGLYRDKHVADWLPMSLRAAEADQ